MTSLPLQLWFACPDDLLDPRIAEACNALLTPQEQQRWQRFKFEKHQRESLATRALVRFALSQHRPQPPESWCFRENEHGKPFLEPDCGLHFNLSNSVSLVACVIAEGAEVGVDIESHARSKNIIEVAGKVFSPEEQAQLEQLDYEAKLDRVLSLWTLKESYIKARGMGLALPLEKISFLYGGPEGVVLKINPAVDSDAGRWQFCCFEHAGHRVAVVVEQAGSTELNLWQSQPLLAKPVSLGTCTAEWFPRG